MPVQLTVVIQDDAGFESVENEAVRQWLVFHVRPDDAQVDLAKRSGMSYRQFRHFMGKLGLTITSLLAARDPESLLDPPVPDPPQTDSTDPCAFCGSLDRIHMHHVVNRYDSPVMVALCTNCHRKFHFLNKLYRVPQRVTKTPIAKRKKVKEPSAL